MLISTIPIQRIRSGFGKTLGDSLQPWILEWILFGATLRGMERGMVRKRQKENSAWQSDQLFYQFAGRRV